MKTIFSRSSFGYVLFAIAVVILSFSVNGWSLWLDEALSAELFVTDTFDELLRKFSEAKGSETQVPGWILCMWTWCKVFGTGEYALRSFNFLPVGLALLHSLYIFMRKGTDLQTKNIVSVSVLLLALSPFVLYNMNEARCNISMFAFSYIATISIWQYLENNRLTDFKIGVISIVVGYLFSMLAGFLLIVLLILALSYGRESMISLKNAVKSSIPLVVGSALVMLAVTVYYLISVFVESKGGQIERPGMGNIGYVLYDYMGFSGLGPRKNELRESTDKVSLLLSYAPYMLPLLICYVAIALQALRNIGKEPLIRSFLTAFVGGFIVFVVAALIIKFRFWSRHLTFLLPMFFLLISCGVIYFWNIGKTWFKSLIIVVFLGSLAFSSYNILFNPYYKKENVRGIVAKCRELRLPEEKIFWQESAANLVYYGLTDSLVYTTAPEVTDHGMYVWFNRMSVNSGAFIGGGKTINKHDEYQQFLNTHKPMLIYRDMDFSVYRF